ncbi:MAG TPA: hypothetical protein VHD35_00915 [Chitinophagaceae bacterium]|nr:hypothetical protein [Chitinophagaceae bacterium]
MNTFLLDAGIGLASNILWILLLILFAVILIEAVVMVLFKIGNFWKAFSHSSIVNIVSTIVGYILINQLDPLSGKISSLEQWLIFYWVTVVMEGLLMMLLFTHTSKSKLWLVTVVMNLVSYVFLYLLTLL